MDPEKGSDTIAAGIAKLGLLFICNSKMNLQNEESKNKLEIATSLKSGFC